MTKAQYILSLCNEAQLPYANPSFHVPNPAKKAPSKSQASRFAGTLRSIQMRQSLNRAVSRASKPSGNFHPKLPPSMMK